MQELVTVITACWCCYSISKKYIIFESIICDYIRGHVNRPYIRDTTTDCGRVNFYTAL